MRFMALIEVGALTYFSTRLGGDIAATEAIVEYLRSCFPSVRAIMPQLAISVGTMIVCVRYPATKTQA